jgi:hypothetical protein
VCRHLEITESAWNRWRNQYGGMKADDVKRLRELERENSRLKRIVAGQVLGSGVLKGLNRGNFWSRTAAGRPSGACSSGSGFLNGGCGRWWASPAAPSGWPRRSLPMTNWPCGPGCVTSPGVVLAGGGAGRPPKRPRRAGGPAASAFTGCGGGEGLKVPYRKREKPLRGIGAAAGAVCPIWPKVIWSLGFCFGQAADGRQLKLRRPGFHARLVTCVPGPGGPGCLHGSTRPRPRLGDAGRGGA